MTGQGSSIFQRLHTAFSEIIRDYEDHSDREVFELIEDDLEVLHRSLEYWREALLVFDAIIDDLEEINRYFSRIRDLGELEKGRMEISVEDSVLNSLTEAEDVLSISEIETLLDEAQEMEEVEVRSIDNPKKEKAVKR